LIPAATRAALLLRWEDEPEDPEDFQSSMYGKRAAEPKRFRVSEKALEFVYTKQRAVHFGRREAGLYLRSFKARRLDNDWA
jgi:hypothetical protein